MLQKGRSLHIGLNHVNNSAYPNFIIPDLNACINDAVSMQTLAADKGFVTLKITDDQATAAEVIRLISSFAQELTTGDIFLLTYSGHGAQIADVDGDEADGMDETWVLWDRMLVDDELYQLFSQFEPGVRIFMLSDSCHSGTVARMMFYEDMHKGLLQSKRAIKPASTAAAQGRPRFRGLPLETANAIYRANKELYDTVRYISRRKRDVSLGAQLILISGCQDSQLSEDGDQNGLFTEKLLQVWNNGSFGGDYNQFASQIIALMPSYQTPNFYTLGDTTEFSAQQPFVINTQQSDPADASDPVMSIRGPATLTRSDSPPDFDIDTQGAPYYVTEFATDISLFAGGDRTPSNFYGSWSESPLFVQSNGFYPMPLSVWNNLKSSDQIFFRVGTTTSQEGWTNYRVSTADGAAAGPSIVLAN